MKKSLIALSLLVFTFNLLAHEYELTSFSSARVRGEAEILAETGQKPANLQAYSCENEERWDLFSSNLEPNPRFDSLRIGVDESYVIYKDQELYEPNGSLYQGGDRFVYKTFRALKAIEDTRVGNRLLQELQKASQPVFIYSGGPRFYASYKGQNPSHYLNNAAFIQSVAILKPVVDRLVFNNVGTGGRAFWTPNFNSKFVEEDYVKRKASDEIVLGHELWHAYDSARGLLDMRYLFSETIEANSVSEIRAVYFENRLRKELGRKYRKFYSGSDDIYSEKDLLDDGAPLFIPAPCIDWL